MVLLGVNSARGRPLGEYIFEKMAKISRTVRKKFPKIPLFLQDYKSDRNGPKFTVPPQHPRVYNQLNASRSGHLGTRYGLTKLKKVQFCHFWDRYLPISPLTMEFGKNYLLHVLPTHQFQATCQISAKSYGSNYEIS